MASSSRNAAFPGFAWPGFAQPGEPQTGGAPAGGGYKYTGFYPVIYPDYLDGQLMTTLSVQPGDTYSIVPVGGDPGISLIPGDGRWIPA